MDAHISGHPQFAGAWARCMQGATGPCLPELYPDRGTESGSNVGGLEGCRKTQGKSYETPKDGAGQ